MGHRSLRSVVVALMLAIPAASSAATLNMLASFVPIDAGSGNLLFEQEHFFFVTRFNPALGSLDAITVSVIRGAVIATIGIDNESSFDAVAFSDDVSAVAFTKVSYSGGTLAQSSVSVDIGPSPSAILGFDTDGAPDFAGSDFLSFAGAISVDSFVQSVTAPATLSDFTGAGLLLVTLTISEIGGSTIPGLQGLTASYGEGIGAIGLSYEYTPTTTALTEPGVLGLLFIGIAAALWRRPTSRPRA